MKEKFVNNLTNFVLKNKECDELKIKTIRYGLEGLYNTITKMIVVIILVLIFKCFTEFLFLFMFYIFLRKYGFGLHASKSIYCWVTTVPVFVGGSLIIKYINFNTYFIYAVWALAIISFILWAPADTPKRPLIRAKLRKQQKIKCIVISIIYLLIIFILNDDVVNAAITLAFIIQVILINPLTYKITNTRFNNYHFYPNKV